jgi:hypothetical protein
MAIELHRHGFPGIAASDITPGAVLKLAAGSVERGVCPVGSTGDGPVVGVAFASAARTEGVTVHTQGDVVKAIARASVGVAGEVNIASTGLGPVAAASGSARYSVGQAISAAAPGEYFSVFVSPKQISGVA